MFWGEFPKTFSGLTKKGCSKENNSLESPIFQANEELELAKKNYEALNIQLLDELPILNSKAFVVLQTCIANFANAHKNFFVEAFDRFSPSVQVKRMEQA